MTMGNDLQWVVEALKDMCDVDLDMLPEGECLLRLTDSNGGHMTFVIEGSHFTSQSKIYCGANVELCKPGAIGKICGILKACNISVGCYDCQYKAPND